ncbi:MAG: zinc ribbon domain-containing protein, partial [Myxococcota bacterium]|nr:zinc ribbon domain-containing protein [Myxococcota bacterium]
MPIYEYECVLHGVFDEARSMKEAHAPAVCVTCGQEATRIVSLPNLRSMVASQLRARDRNERSRHEPKVLAGDALTAERGQPAKGGGAPVSAGASTARPW